MKLHIAIALPTTVALIAALSSPLLAQTPSAPPAIGAAQLVQTLEASGYRDIRGLELDDGLWEADATSPRGFEIELTINPSTGAILNPEVSGGVNAQQVLSGLQQLGYTDVRTLEFDDGMLETEARDAQGRWVELRLDGVSGAVVHSEIDD
jgi:hypothetical protein